jgi:hypothetical protein
MAFPTTKILVKIDGVEYRVLADPERWEKSTKPYLLDCGHNIEEFGPFIEEHEITDDLLSDLLEARDE